MCCMDVAKMRQPLLHVCSAGAFGWCRSFRTRWCRRSLLPLVCLAEYGGIVILPVCCCAAPSRCCRLTLWTRSSLVNMSYTRRTLVLLCVQVRAVPHTPSLEQSVLLFSGQPYGDGYVVFGSKVLGHVIAGSSLVRCVLRTDFMRNVPMGGYGVALVGSCVVVHVSCHCKLLLLLCSCTT